MGRVFSLAGAAIDCIKVNDLRLGEHEGRSVWIKRRRRGAGIVLHSANLFFRAVGNPVRVFTDRPEWQEWETSSFLTLHGDRYWAGVADSAVLAECVPGKSLSQHLDANELSAEMCHAAALELRRAHSIHSPVFNGPWSHGDPHLGNFIYSGEENRARLIDFEVMHRTVLKAVERHADDLLVFLLDLCGRVAAERWLPLGLSFVNGYGVPIVLQNLKTRLIVPRGLAAVWWSIRTTYMRRAEIVSRIEQLRVRL